MPVRSVTAEQLAERKADREAADRRYNDALTALDRALRPLPEDFPHPPPAPDETLVTPVNIRWRLLEGAPAFADGWRGRLARFVWGVVEPALARQQEFNAALVEHINRNVQPQREVPKAIGSTLAVLREQLEQVLAFQSRLLVFLQQLTPYVDTKDYEFAALARRLSEDVADQAEGTDRIARGLAGGLHGLSDELLRRFESLTTRDARYASAIADLRTSVGALQALTQALRRDVEQRRGTGEGGRGTGHGERGTGDGGRGTGHGERETGDGGRGTGNGEREPLNQLASDRLLSHHYVGFEDAYRGSELDIAGRLSRYVELFRGSTDVLDIGCGRGELLLLLREAGIPARGIDLNPEMVERCRARGLHVEEADALSYLERLDHGGLGGLIGTQVVEHLQPDYLLRLLSTTFDKLRPGAVLVLETVNPASWAAFFDSYLRDLTHVRPVHPDTLRYLVMASGFSDVRVEWQAPYPETSKLQKLPTTAADASLLAVINGNVDRLNERLFTFMDYAVIATRSGGSEPAHT